MYKYGFARYFVAIANSSINLENAVVMREYAVFLHTHAIFCTLTERRFPECITVDFGILVPSKQDLCECTVTLEITHLKGMEILWRDAKFYRKTKSGWC